MLKVGIIKEDTTTSTTSSSNTTIITAASEDREATLLHTIEISTLSQTFLPFAPSYEASA
jgi:hypothetical protein